MDNRFDPRILELIPHRPPMLLINQINHVDVSDSSSMVFIDEQAPFFEQNRGVPSWVGIEYMGQTAALIAGYRLEKGLLEPNLGFLIGTRSFVSESEYFEPGTTLRVNCKEHAQVADGFAKFDCEIEKYDTVTGSTELLAKASLSVFRRLLNKKE